MIGLDEKITCEIINCNDSKFVKAYFFNRPESEDEFQEWVKMMKEEHREGYVEFAIRDGNTIVMRDSSGKTRTFSKKYDEKEFYNTGFDNEKVAISNLSDKGKRIFKDEKDGLEYCARGGDIQRYSGDIHQLAVKI